MSRIKSYIICTSPRSGSTLLCNLLAATHTAGKPASLFYETSLEGWREDLGVTDPDLSGRDLLDALFKAAIRLGRGETDMFSLRQQRASFAFLTENLAVLHPDAPGDLARITRVFGPTRFIHLTRADKLAQAVSLCRAKQSGLWHVARDGSEHERSAPHRDPVYDRDEISAMIDLLTAYDRDWLHWFAQEGIAPLRLSYDALSADPKAVLREALTFLDRDPQLAETVAPALRKMADETSDNWIARYRAGTA